MDRRLSYALHLIPIAIFLGMVSPHLFTDGMFTDGLMYATIAHNLSHGIGDMWNPAYTRTTEPQFYSHPPLMFWMQSVMFSIFGSSILVERLFSVATYLVIAHTMLLTWRSIVSGDDRSYTWLPLLYWVGVPLVTWAVSNNMLETTMMMFLGFSVLLQVWDVQKKAVWCILVSGVFIFLATLTKGFVALFPLSIPFFAWSLGMFSFQRSVQNTVLLLLTLTVCYTTLFWGVDGSYAYYTKYIDAQLIHSFENIRTVDNRLFLSWRCISELAPAMAVGLIMRYVGRKSQYGHQYARWALLFLCIGLSAVIPLMITFKQRDFYMLPSFTFFALAIAFVTLPYAKYIVEDYLADAFRKKVTISIAVFLFSIAMLMQVYFYGKIGRDHGYVADSYALREYVHPDAIIACTDSISYNLSFQSYLMRNAKISVDDRKPYSHTYLITRKEDAESLNNYERVPQDFEEVILYRRVSLED